MGVQESKQSDSWSVVRESPAGYEMFGDRVYEKFERRKLNYWKHCFEGSVVLTPRFAEITEEPLRAHLTRELRSREPLYRDNACVM